MNITKLPKLNHSTKIHAKCHLTDKLLSLDLILGRDILDELGIIFNFKIITTTWQEVFISMKPPNFTTKNSCNQRKSSSKNCNSWDKINFRYRI